MKKLSFSRPVGPVAAKPLHRGGGEGSVQVADQTAPPNLPIYFGYHTRFERDLCLGPLLGGGWKRWLTHRVARCLRLQYVLHTRSVSPSAFEASLVPSHHFQLRLLPSPSSLKPSPVNH